MSSAKALEVASLTFSLSRTAKKKVERKEEKVKKHNEKKKAKLLKATKRAEKDAETLARAAALSGLDVRVVGPLPPREVMVGLQTLSKGQLSFEGPMRHADVPDRLARFRVLALPLSDGLFGAHLTSPLKLFDYQAVGRPILAADTPALRAAAGDTAHWYRPGDVGGFCSRAEALLANPPRERPPIRTWAMRAAELDTLLDEALG